MGKRGGVAGTQCPNSYLIDFNMTKDEAIFVANTFIVHTRNMFRGGKQQLLSDLAGMSPSAVRDAICRGKESIAKRGVDVSKLVVK